jgi:rhodanese-related sulfurtransferase
VPPGAVPAAPVPAEAEPPGAAPSGTAASGTVPSGTAASGTAASGQAPASQARPAGARSIDEILAAARGRLSRLTPREALAELAGGGATTADEAPRTAVLVDIRPASQRAADGEVPGSWVVERNHLEWRLDPDSPARLPWVAGFHHRVIVICQEGYTSSLAAAALLDLGLSRSTDVIGGFRAWVGQGLPIAPASARAALIAMGAAPAG